MRCSRSSVASRFVMWLVLALFVGTATVAVGQVTSGSINGTVRDSTGAVIPHATVTVANPSTGVARTVTTNDTGDFIVPNLPPGDYTIRVEAQGFKALEKSDVRLSATDRLNAGAFELELGGTAEVVNVTAGAGELQLQANSGERSDLITGNQLNNLALNGGNILDFVKVVPGIVSSFDCAVTGTGGIDAFNVNGTRANQHEFTIDGSSNVDTGNNGGTHVTLNPDAVAEMKILTSNYQAEFGKAGGGQLVVTTKSGSRDFHGSGRYFARNEALNANSWFANQDGTEKPEYRYNYFGYDVGGPVLIPKTGFNSTRDKLFFFWGQEYYRQRVPGGLDQFRVPTAAERTGDFSQTADGNGNPLVIYNPATGQPFPGNRIDRNALPRSSRYSMRCRRFSTCTACRTSPRTTRTTSRRSCPDDNRFAKTSCGSTTRSTPATASSAADSDDPSSRVRCRIGI